MSLNTILPPSYSDARPMLQKALQLTAAAQQTLVGSNVRPNPPRSLILQPGSQKVLITWNSPQDDIGIVGWHVYKDVETNLIATINDVTNRQIQVQVPAGKKTAFYISGFNVLEMDSIKVQIIGSANSDSYVVTGTSGATPGMTPGLPPGYPEEPTGGGGPTPQQPD